MRRTQRPSVPPCASLTPPDTAKPRGAHRNLRPARFCRPSRSRTIGTAVGAPDDAAQVLVATEDPGPALRSAGQTPACPPNGGPHNHRPPALTPAPRPPPPPRSLPASPPPAHHRDRQRPTLLHRLHKGAAAQAFWPLSCRHSRMVRKPGHPYPFSNLKLSSCSRLPTAKISSRSLGKDYWPLAR
jgi:hypothetical protein